MVRIPPVINEDPSPYPVPTHLPPPPLEESPVVKTDPPVVVGPEGIATVMAEGWKFNFVAIAIAAVVGYFFFKDEPKAKRTRKAL